MKPRARIISAIVTFAIAAGIAGSAKDCARDKRARSSTDSSGGEDSPTARSKSPIERHLASEQTVATRDGVAIAILIDTSGSMKKEVRDADGEERPKLAIARRAALDLVKRTQAFAREHADVPLQVGLYEFSTRDRVPACRPILAMGAPDPERSEKALAALKARGDTPIGDAMIAAKKELDRTGLSRRHILVVTDGENTKGYDPGDVTSALARLPDAERVSAYLIAFDVQASNFDGVKEAGGLVLSASSGKELDDTLDYVLSGKILAEAPLGAR